MFTQLSLTFIIITQNEYLNWKMAHPTEAWRQFPLYEISHYGAYFISSIKYNNINLHNVLKYLIHYYKISFVWVSSGIFFIKTFS